ncbi:MAG: hypothetical protein WCA08_15035 [Desulfoferrobacter sp.]
MTDIFDHLISHGMSVQVDDGKLICSPKANITDELRDYIRKNKRDIIRFLNDPANRWKALALTGLSDMDVIPLDEGLFLFAIQKIRKASPSELLGIRARYEKYWRQRLPKEAYLLVRDELHRQDVGMEVAQ